MDSARIALNQDIVTATRPLYEFLIIDNNLLGGLKKDQLEEAKTQKKDTSTY